MLLIRGLLIALALLALAAAPARAAGTFGSGRYEGRGYALFTPSTPAAAPLVVALHGCWQTPEDFALGTQLNDLIVKAVGSRGTVGILGLLVGVWTGLGWMANLRAAWQRAR